MANLNFDVTNQEIRELLAGHPTLEELENRKTDLDSMFVDLDNEIFHEQLEALITDVQDEIDRLKWGDFDDSEEISDEDLDIESPINIDAELPSDPENASSKTHDAEAWEYFNKGQTAFVEGDYNQALQYYELALQIEPEWATVQDARELSQKYQSGDIPEKSLPSEVQRLYRTALNETKKIESRTNAEDYANALTLLGRAKQALQKAQNIFQEKTKLDSWDDAYNLEVQLDDLEVQIEQAQLAKSLFNDARELFNNNKLSEAIDKARLANETQNMLAYQDVTDQWEEFRVDVNTLNAELNTGDLSIDDLSNLLKTVRKHEAQFPNHPALANIQAKVKEKTPELIKHLENQMTSFAEKAKRARTQKEAETNVNKAKNALKQRRNIGGGQEKIQELIEFENELDEVGEQILTYKINLETASDLMHGGETGWQDQVVQVARQAMRRFSQDPETISIRSEINRHNRKKVFRYVWIGLLVILAIVVCVSVAGGSYWYFTNQPTPTLSPTITQTATATLPPTATVTPKPPRAFMLQGAWAKNTCYEGTGTGHIPKNARVQLMTHEFEESKEFGPCALVHYSDGEKSVTGWVPVRWLDIP
jgi:tetratricopeptide (TPR) repeat protein